MCSRVNVQSGKCRSGNCPVGDVSAGEVLVWKMSSWQLLVFYFIYLFSLYFKLKKYIGILVQLKTVSDAKNNKHAN